MNSPQGPTTPENDFDCPAPLKKFDTVFAKIKAASLRVGFNLWEIFRRLDENGTNYVSEPAFLRVFLGPLKNIIGLSRSDIAFLLQEYQVEDGQVPYARILQNAYKRLSPPEQTDQQRELERQLPNRLPSDEEDHLLELLSKFSIAITPLDPPTTLDDMRKLFMNFEGMEEGSGLVDIDGFLNVLRSFSDPFSSSDIALLIQRYRYDKYSIKYKALLKELEQVAKYLKDNGIVNADGTLHGDSISKLQDLNMTSLQHEDFIGIDKIWNKDFNNSRLNTIQTCVAFNKIKEQVYNEQLRVRHFFIHYDPMETGSVESHIMRKCISWICVCETSFNDLYLTAKEVDLLIKVYEHPVGHDSYLWKVFEQDLERGADPSELESWGHKSISRKSADPLKVLFRPPTPPPEKKEITIQDVLLHIYKSMENHGNRSVVFAEIEKTASKETHCLTPRQLERAFVKCHIFLSCEEQEILCKRYGDRHGINWIKFAEELDTFRENQNASHEIQESKEKKKALAIENEHKLALREGSIIEILAKIKSVLVCKRVWIKNYLKTYDSLEKNVITKAEFEDGLGQCGVKLSTKEMNVVFDVFGNPSNPDELEYKRFCRVVDEDFLPPCPIRTTLEDVIAREKAIPEKVDGAQPTHLWANYNQRKGLEKAMDRLFKYIGIANTEYYKGLDENNTGTISKDLFRKSLVTLNCSELLSNQEIDNLIHCFGIKKGAFVELDYLSFLRALDSVSKAKAMAKAH